MHPKKKQKKLIYLCVTSLVGLLLAGCATDSKKIVLQEEYRSSVNKEQYKYEHIPKPVAYLKPSVSEQRKELYSDVKDTMREIGEYKKKMRSASASASDDYYSNGGNGHNNTNGVRYGKNRIIKKPSTYTPPTTTSTPSNEFLLYPNPNK
jgi:hypothetical protein